MHLYPVVTNAYHDCDKLSLISPLFGNMFASYHQQSPDSRLFNIVTTIPQLRKLQFFPHQPNAFLTTNQITANIDKQPVYASEINQRTASWLFRRFFKPLHWLVSSKKLLSVMGMMLPISYIASGYGEHGFAPNAMHRSVDMLSINQHPTSLSSASGVTATSTHDMPTNYIPTTYNSIVTQKQLRLATVNDATTHFSEDGFEHGFGYDILRRYANRLNVNLATTVFQTPTQAIAAVKAGKADMALTNTHTIRQAANDELASLSLTCNNDYLTSHGLNSQVALQFNNTDKKLASDIGQFLCNKDAVMTNQQLAAFYNQNLLNEPYSQQHFAQTVNNVLPVYEVSFKTTAKKYNLDWELLVAMGYQESHLDAQAVSPTGVRGIMMLTNSTADAMGVKDRIDPAQSIQGGAKYLKQLENQFSEVPKSDRVWFTLAAYNMGPQAVKNIQQALNKRGRDGNSWAQVYQYLTINRNHNSRYTQCINYVTHIRSYFEALKLDDFNTRSVA